MSGEAFKRQLALGHSAYIYSSPDLGFFNFAGLHHVYPDGVSGRHYWMFMQPDARVADPGHWLQTASQQEKLDHVLQSVAKLPPKLQEIFQSTPVNGIKKEPHIWRDLELNSLPTGRVVLVGDAAHAMTPFRGEGGYHALIDAMRLSKVLGQLDIEDSASVKTAVAEYNAEMLDRGADAVRNSRNEHSTNKPADKKAKPMSAGQLVRPLPEVDISLQVGA